MLDKYPGFETREPEVNREILFANFGARNFDCSHRERPFLAKGHSATTKYFRITSGYCSISTDTKYEASTAIRQFICAGSATNIAFDIKAQAKSLTPTAPIVIVPADTAYRCMPSNEHAVIALRIESAALASIATAMLGKEVSTESILIEQWNNDVLQSCYVDEVRRFVTDLDTSMDANSYAAETFGQALLVRFMLGSTSDFACQLRTKVPAPSLAQLKAIEEYIAANWQKGIDIEDIAEIFGISVRSVFRYFKSLRGTTPFEFIKTLKLERARTMLQSADREDGVMRIALRCGFQGMGHFAREYQKRYGELPSETLRNAKSTAAPRKTDIETPDMP